MPIVAQGSDVAHGLPENFLIVNFKFEFSIKKKTTKKPLINYCHDILESRIY